jgi:hypothetical protein
LRTDFFALEADLRFFAFFAFFAITCSYTQSKTITATSSAYCAWVAFSFQPNTALSRRGV